jgi:hypothetical protein
MNTDTLDKMKRMQLLSMHRSFKISLETPLNQPIYHRADGGNADR